MRKTDALDRFYKRELEKRPVLTFLWWVPLNLIILGTWIFWMPLLLIYYFVKALLEDKVEAKKVEYDGDPYIHKSESTLHDQTVPNDTEIDTKMEKGVSKDIPVETEDNEEFDEEAYKLYMDTYEDMYDE